MNTIRIESWPKHAGRNHPPNVHECITNTIKESRDLIIEHRVRLQERKSSYNIYLNNKLIFDSALIHHY